MRKSYFASPAEIQQPWDVLQLLSTFSIPILRRFFPSPSLPVGNQCFDMLRPTRIAKKDIASAVSDI
jgi:hypothetical protein